MRKALSGAVLVLAIAAAAAAPVPGAAAEGSDGPQVPSAATEASSAPQVSAIQVAPGVTYRRIVNREIPRRIHVLIIEASSPATLDVALARRRFPGFVTTSKMVRRAGALAGVNGDFGRYPGRPGHAFAEDGDLVQTSVLGPNGKAFALSQDEQTGYVGAPDVQVSVEDLTRPGLFTVARWNKGEPGPGEVVGFTPAGGTLEEPPDSSCSARLLPDGARRWSDPAQSGIVRPYVVDAVRCGAAPMAREGGVVVVSRQNGMGALVVSALVPGDDVEVTWTMGWPGTVEMMGGSPVLLQDGVDVTDGNCHQYLCLRHPRTGVGVRANGDVLLVVVDGRITTSKGVTPSEFAQIMKELGAVDALNLDGGGSSTMVVDGRIKNAPTDGVERKVSTALVVLPGPDSDENVLPAT